MEDNGKVNTTLEELKRIKSSNEALKQELHELKIAKSSSDVVVKELGEENIFLQKELKLLKSKEKENFTGPVNSNHAKALVREIEDLTEEVERTEEMQKDLLKKQEEEIVEISNLKEISIALEEYNQCKNDTASIEEEIPQLMEELSRCQSTVEDKNCCIKSLQLKLKNTIEEYEEILSLHNEIAAELDKILSSSKAKKGENVLLTNELTSLKESPADETQRGNSLFAEIEDNHNVLTKKTDLLKSRCARNQHLLNTENNKIQEQKNKITRALRSSIENKCYKDFEVEGLQSRRKKLKEIIKLASELKQRTESPQIVTKVEKFDCKLKWINVLIDEARKKASETMNSVEKNCCLFVEEAEKYFDVWRNIQDLKNKNKLNIDLIKNLENSS